MKTRTLLVLAAFAALLAAASSCSSPRYVSAQSDYSAKWVGRPTVDIIAECGAPDRETTDGNGGRILVYEDFHTEVVSYSGGFYGPGFYGPWGPWGGWGGPTRTETETQKSYVHFYVNAADVCYLVQTNHVKQEGYQPDYGRTIAGTVAGITLGALLLRAIAVPARIL